MFRMVADKLILNLMERMNVYVNVSVCHQLTMILIVLSSESFFWREKSRKTYLFAWLDHALNSNLQRNLVYRVSQNICQNLENSTLLFHDLVMFFSGCLTRGVINAAIIVLFRF